MKNDSPPTTTDDRFPNIAKRTTATGTYAYVKGTGIRVWQMVKTARALNDDVDETAAYLDIDVALVDEAMAYARCHGREVEEAIARHERYPEQHGPSLDGAEPGVRGSPRFALIDVPSQGVE